MTRPDTVPLPAVALVVALLLAPMVENGAEAAQPVERHHWVAGVAYGAGRAEINLSGENAAGVETGWRGGASPQFRLGRMIGRHLMIGLEDRQWMDEGGLGDYKVRTNVQNFTLVLTAYPGRTSDLTSGIFVQVGVGIAHARISALEPVPGGSNEWGETYEEVLKRDESGSGYLVGAGYEWRISSHFALGLTTSYNVLDFDEIFDQVKFFPGGLNLNWYF